MLVQVVVGADGGWRLAVRGMGAVAAWMLSWVGMTVGAGMEWWWGDGWWCVMGAAGSGLLQGVVGDWGGAMREEAVAAWILPARE